MYRKKVAFIGKFSNLYDEEGKARALESIGVAVERFDELSFNKVTGNDTSTLLSGAPSVVFYTKLRISYAQQLIDECRERNIKTVCWMPDLYFGLQREAEVMARTPMFQADYVLTPDGGNQARFEAFGVNHFLVRQAIDEKSCEYLSKEPKEHDLLFVGTLGAEHGSPRRRLLEHLTEKYKGFHWVGKRGPNEIRNKELTQLISSSKIVIGDCVYSENYWSNRLYEMIGRGGFLLHPHIPGLEKELTSGEHFVSFEYGNMKYLDEKIDKYLEDPKAREEISRKGNAFVKENHTLTDRAVQVMGIIS